MPQPEMHQRALAPAQVRFAIDEQAGRFSGYAAVFNDLVPTYNERVLPGAFSRSLAERSARGDALAILWAHDPREVIGVATSLAEDSYGLRVEGRLILNIDRARDAYTLIREGINSLSIGFWPVKWTRNDQGEVLIEDAELFEFSVVYAGASPRAKITEIRQTGGTPMPDPIVPETPAPTPAAPDLAAIEARMTEMQTRLDEYELRAQRPGPHGGDDVAQRESRALATFIRTGNETEMRAAATDSGPDGGWLVLPTIDTSIRTVVRDMSPMRQIAEVVSISGSTYERFYSVGQNGASWVSERETRPQDTNRPQLKKHSYGVAELYACPAATRHQLEDASIDISAWLIGEASTDFAIAEGTAFLNGDGVDGSPRGLLTYDIDSASDFSRDWGSYQYITLPNFGSEAMSDTLIRLMMSLRGPYRQNARWLMSRDTAITVRQLRDAQGRYLWAPTGNLLEGEQGNLLGFPVSYDDDMPPLEAGESPSEPTTPIAFGDFRKGYVVVDRHGIRVERDAVTVKGQVRFDTYKRVGGGAGDYNAIKFMRTSV